MSKKKSEIDLELGIAKEFEEYKEHMSWIQSEIKERVTKDIANNTPQETLDYLKLYRDINQEVLDKSIQNVAFLKMVEGKLKEERETFSAVQTPKTAGLG